MNRISGPGGSRSAVPRLSAEQILAVAVSIADREGLAAVSMRRLARELSVTAMALYRHFEDKDRLLDAMAERMVGQARFEDDPGSAWDDRFRAILTGLVSLLHEHPWMGRLVIERLVPQPKYLEALEILLDSLRQAGLTIEQGAVLTQQAVQALVSLVDYEPDPKQSPAQLAAEQEAVRRLDSDSFPNVRAAAVPLSGEFGLDTYYQLGIDMIVEGIGRIADWADDDAARSSR